MIDPIAIKIAFQGIWDQTTTPAKAQLIDRLRAGPSVEKLALIYSGLHQVRKIRRILIAKYRAMLRGDDPDILEPA